MKKTIITSPRDRRVKRIRAKVNGTLDRPRLSVYKSNTAIYAQLIDDENGKTLASSTSLNSKSKNKTDASNFVGNEIASKAIKLNIKKVVFDRGGFIYTGRIKALADSARNAGLEF